jgi:chemotaxis signal transduction protein
MDRQLDPVFLVTASAQAQFLEQLSDEDFWKYAQESVHTLPTAPAQGEEYLVCELEDVACVLPLTVFHEAVPVPHHFTFLPDAPSWMPGITTWRGEIIAVVELGAYLANHPARLLAGGMLLIAHHDDILLGLLVSSIRTTVTVQAAQTRTPSQLQSLRVEVLPGVYADAIVLDIPAILVDVVQHIGTTL